MWKRTWQGRHGNEKKGAGRLACTLRRIGGVARDLALARLELADGLVDDVDAATPLYHAAIFVAIFQRLQRVDNFHGTGLRRQNS